MRRQGQAADRPAGREGQVLARPAARTARPEATTPQAGQYRLGLGGRRDGLLYVPVSCRLDRPAPFALMLHGAGGSASHGLALLRPLADAAGLVLLSVDSRGRTWDVLLDDFGPDVQFINDALEHAFERCSIDPSRVAIGGFSDGASYALSLGIGNGELFTHVIAFSPGFMASPHREGTPRIYISHGTRDRVLAIDPCSRRIVPRLQRTGYDVLYREFDGPHTIPPEISAEAVNWFLGG